jgi:hypothetical protein
MEGTRLAGATEQYAVAVQRVQILLPFQTSLSRHRKDPCGVSETCGASEDTSLVLLAGGVVE